MIQIDAGPVNATVTDEALRDFLVTCFDPNNVETPEFTEPMHEAFSALEHISTHGALSQWREWSRSAGTIAICMRMDNMDPEFISIVALNLACFLNMMPRVKFFILTSKSVNDELLYKAVCYPAAMHQVYFMKETEIGKDVESFNNLLFTAAHTCQVLAIVPHDRFLGKGFFNQVTEIYDDLLQKCDLQKDFTAINEKLVGVTFECGVLHSGEEMVIVPSWLLLAMNGLNPEVGFKYCVMEFLRRLTAIGMVKQCDLASDAGMVVPYDFSASQTAVLSALDGDDADLAKRASRPVQCFEDCFLERPTYDRCSVFFIETPDDMFGYRWNRHEVSALRRFGVNPWRLLRSRSKDIFLKELPITAEMFQLRYAFENQNQIDEDGYLRWKAGIEKKVTSMDINCEADNRNQSASQTAEAGKASVSQTAEAKPAEEVEDISDGEPDAAESDSMQQEASPDQTAEAKPTEEVEDISDGERDASVSQTAATSPGTMFFDLYLLFILIYFSMLKIVFELIFLFLKLALCVWDRVLSVSKIKKSQI